MCQKIVVTLPNNLRIRVALYIRVSTEEQAKHGLSLADQREALTDYAAAHNMEVVGIYEDAGISARKPYKKRPALMRLLDDCNAGKVDTILFVKLIGGFGMWRGTTPFKRFSTKIMWIGRPSERTTKRGLHQGV